MDYLQDWGTFPDIIEDEDSYLQDWGISPDTLNTIDDAARLCEDILSKAGYTPDAINEWRYDVRHNTVLENGNITNSIIKGYFSETARLLKEKGYDYVNYYVDLGLSHFILNGSFHIDSCSLIFGYELPTVEQLAAYEKYKDKWIAEHISDEVMKATTAVWVSNPEYSNYFEEYLEEYGFINGECYDSFEEFLRNNEYAVSRDDKTAHNKSSNMEKMKGEPYEKI